MKFKRLGGADLFGADLFRRWLTFPEMATHQSPRRCLLLCACRASYEVVRVMQRLSHTGHSKLDLRVS